MTVLSQTPYTRAVGNGVTTVFPFTFKLLNESDLVVSVDGVAIPSTAYSVSGLGENAGGDVTFLVAPANSADVFLERVIAFERLVDYQYAGDLKAEVLNPDVDRLWMAMQQIQSLFDRSIHFPAIESGIASELPSRSARLNNLLGFNENGELVAVAPAAQSASALQALLAQSSGSSLVGFLQAGIGAIARTLQSKAREHLSINDFCVCDGVTDDSAKLTAAITAAPVGAVLYLHGFCRLASPIVITKRIGIICPSAADAFIVDVGITNDAITWSGTAAGINDIEIKLNVYGAALCCKDAVVLSRVDRSPNIELNVYAGAVGYAVALKGLLINKIKVNSSGNFTPPPLPITPGFQAKHVLLDKALGVAFNANELWVNLEGGGDALISTDMGGEGDNIISGTIEGIIGRSMHLIGCSGVTVRDMHFELNTLSPKLEGCSLATVGPNVYNATEETPLTLVNCRQTFMDGYYGSYTADSNCSNTTVGRILTTSSASHSQASYYDSTENIGPASNTSGVISGYSGNGRLTVENLFHNPFIDIWTNGAASAPDGFTLTNATVAQLTNPDPVYTHTTGKSAEVTVTVANISSGIFASCKSPNNVGQQSGHFMAVSVAVYVKTGQPDVSVLALTNGQYLDLGRVTVKDQWVLVRGYAIAAVGSVFQPHIVPWNFTSGLPVTGKFILGGLNISKGNIPAKYISDDGKRSDHIVDSVTNAPAFIGQRAFLSGTTKWYMAKGTASAADWVILN